MKPVTIHYRQEFFGETTTLVPGDMAAPGMPRGLVGRQVANAEMLRALLQHGSSTEIHFLVDTAADARSLRTLLKRQLPAGKKGVIKHLASIDDWMSKPQQHVIWEPQPPTYSLAWTRSRVAPMRVAIGGVTHALCSASAVAAIRQLVTSPTRNFDRLVCTSDAVAHTVRTLIDHWSGVIGKADDDEMIQLETIPLGVDCQRHRRATTQERIEVRRELGISDNADVVLFVGRLSHHAKSNPLAMFAACQQAASVSGRPVVLLLAGWYASDAVRSAFESEANRVAADVTVLHVNAMEDLWRDRIWAAADLFVSLADSIQETFGLTVVEAMSRGLAVVASDWDGYRDTVIHEHTGLLVPTTMVVGAGERALLAMHEDRLNYDHFLAAVGQTVNVSTAEACSAVQRLLLSPSLRMKFAEAGSQRAQEFSWENIVARYERLWSEQDRLMTLQSTGPRTYPCRLIERPTTLTPTVHELFNLYPSRWVTMETELTPGDKRLGDLGALAKSPLANHSEQWRCSEQGISDLIDAVAPQPTCPITTFHLSMAENTETMADTDSTRKFELLDSIAWTMKYDFVKCRQPTTVGQTSLPRIARPEQCDITFTTTCMGRLAHLQQTLPRLVAQSGCHVVVVDYSCPEQTSLWVSEHYSPDEVTVVRVLDRQHFNMGEAKNAAVMMARSEWVCMVDADVLVSDDFANKIRTRLSPGRFLRRMVSTKGVGGTIVAQRHAILQVGLHDPNFRQWGEEDEDLLDALRFIGHQPGAIPEELLKHLEHDDATRSKNYATSDLRTSHLTNRIYRAAKWDMARINGSVPRRPVLHDLYQMIHSQVTTAIADRSNATIMIPLGAQPWRNLSANASRMLAYTIDVDAD